MRILSFIASSYLFLGATSGMLLSWMLNTTKEPWLLDAKHTNFWLGLFPESDITALMNHIEDIYPPLYRLIQLGYTIVGLILLLASLLVFGVLFLAPRNKALNLVVHFVCTSWIWLFGWKTGLLFQIPIPGHTNFSAVRSSISYSSTHATLYWLLLFLSNIGTIAYIFHIYQPKKVKNANKNEKTKEN